MKAASAPRALAHQSRLLHVDPRRNDFTHRRLVDLPLALRSGDLVVINDAATLPASLRVPELDVEFRLVARGTAENAFSAVLFGSGDYHTPTELRPAPPRVAVGQRLDVGSGLSATVTHVDETSPRFIDISFSLSGAPLLSALYRAGRPIQYAHVPEALELWDVQNRYASRPWAFELPSAGLPIDGELLLALRARRVAIVTLTHAAGISSTGSEPLDRRLPLPERFEIPEATVSAIAATKARGGGILAVGTTVVRALESNASEDGTLSPGLGEAHLVVKPGFRPRVATGILSGMHEPGTSHFDVLRAFAPSQLLESSLESAGKLGYLEHEFGDSCLIWPSIGPVRP